MTTRTHVLAPLATLLATLLAAVLATFLTLAAATTATAATAAAAADDGWTVTLRDGTVHEGTLLRIMPGLYILETDAALYELSDDDIDPRTFADRPRSEAQPTRSLSVTNHHVELHWDGTAATYLTFFNHNQGGRVITEYRYGLAPWEQREIDQRTLRDGHGNVLHLEFDPPREEWEPYWDRRVQVSARLPIPVAPGEYWTVASQTIARANYRKVDGGWAWSHPGDYADDRLVWFKVRLPQGARMVEVSPEPSAIFDEGGFRYVIWRQFYRAGERRSLEVVFAAE